LVREQGLARLRVAQVIDVGLRGDRPREVEPVAAQPARDLVHHFDAAVAVDHDHAARHLFDHGGQLGRPRPRRRVLLGDAEAHPVHARRQPPELGRAVDRDRPRQVPAADSRGHPFQALQRQRHGARGPPADGRQREDGAGE